MFYLQIYGNVCLFVCLLQSKYIVTELIALQITYYMSRIIFFMLVIPWTLTILKNVSHDCSRSYIHLRLIFNVLYKCL
jgi:hypothetical protein